MYISGVFHEKLILYSAALIDVEDLSNLNEEWRKKEASDLQNLVQQRLNYLQVSEK